MIFNKWIKKIVKQIKSFKDTNDLFILADNVLLAQQILKENGFPFKQYKKYKKYKNEK